jgi:proline dehydrogenase
MSRLTQHDRAALAEAVALIQDVIARHPLEYTAVIGVHVQAAVHDIDLVRKDFEERR